MDSNRRNGFKSYYKSHAGSRLGVAGRSGLASRRGGQFKGRMRGGDPDKVERLLAGAFKKLGIAKDIQRYQFVLHWESIVGPELAQVCKPECLVGKALIIRVLNSAWAQQLSLQSERILLPLRRYFAENQAQSTPSVRKSSRGDSRSDIPEIEELRFFSGDLAAGQ